MCPRGHVYVCLDTYTCRVWIESGGVGERDMAERPARLCVCGKKGGGRERDRGRTTGKIGRFRV